MNEAQARSFQVVSARLVIKGIFLSDRPLFVGIHTVGGLAALGYHDNHYKSFRYIIF